MHKGVAVIEVVEMFGLLAFTVLFVALLLFPIGLLLLRRCTTVLRRLLVLALGYLVLSAAAGGLAYGMLPADYTKFHRWTLHPTANSLAEIHAVDLARMGQPGAFDPRYAPIRRAEIRAERLRYARDWGVVMGWALVPVLLGFISWRVVRWRLSAG